MKYICLVKFNFPSFWIKYLIFLCIFIFFYIIRPLHFDRNIQKPLCHPIILFFYDSPSCLSHQRKKLPKYKPENATVNGSNSKPEKFSTVFPFSTMQKETPPDFLTLPLLLPENTRDERCILSEKPRRK